MERKGNETCAKADKRAGQDRLSVEHARRQAGLEVCSQIGKRI